MNKFLHTSFRNVPRIQVLGNKSDQINVVESLVGPIDIEWKHPTMLHVKHGPRENRKFYYYPDISLNYAQIISRDMFDCHIMMTNPGKLYQNVDLNIIAMGGVEASNKAWYNYLCNLGLFKNVLGVITVDPSQSNPDIIARLYDEYEILGYGYYEIDHEHLKNRIGSILAMSQIINDEL